MAEENKDIISLISSVADITDKEFIKLGQDIIDIKNILKIIQKDISNIKMQKKGF